MSIYTNNYALRDFTGLARALADQSRVRALMALKDHELCVCQLVELLGLASSTVSRHLAILSQAYMVDSRKEGRWVYYRRSGARAPVAVQAALDWVDRSVADSSEVIADREKLELILSCPVDELCRSDSRTES
jgi:DNA-binding transcriptional ArsR family regulator